MSGLAVAVCSIDLDVKFDLSNEMHVPFRFSGYFKRLPAAGGGTNRG